MVATRGGDSFSRQHPLLGALLSDDAAALERHLAGGDVQSLMAAAAGPGGITPLHVCAMLDAPACVTALLAAGAEVDAATEKALWAATKQERDAWPLAGKLKSWSWRLSAGTTPLSLAAQLGSEATAALLLDAGADVWQVADRECSAGVVRLVTQRAAAGKVQLAAAGAEKLGRLLRGAAAAGPAACLECCRSHSWRAPRSGPRTSTACLEAPLHLGTQGWCGTCWSWGQTLWAKWARSWSGAPQKQGRARRWNCCWMRGRP